MTQRAAASPDETVSYTPVMTRGPVLAEVAAEIYAQDVEDDDDFGDRSSRIDYDE